MYVPSVERVQAVATLVEPCFRELVDGLGMAIAGNLLESHGGKIALGRLGPGTEIVIVLPRETP